MNKQAKQRIFTQVKCHLLKQNAKSVKIVECGDESCTYRGADGRTCAIGCLIPNWAYDKTMEGSIAENLVKDFPVVGLLLEVDHESDLQFLNKLQSIHDSWLVQDWEEELQDFAIENKLYYNQK